MKRPGVRFARPAVLLLALAPLLSCSGPVVTAVGSSNDLVIIHDEGAFELAELVVASLEAPQSWLLGEPSFKTTVTTLERSGDLKNLRHVLLVGSWNDGTVRGMARKVFRGLSEESPTALHVTTDVWARRQVVGVLMGANADAIAAFLRDNGDQVRAEMEASALSRLSSSLRKTAVEAGMAQALAERFGWSISPPTGYDFFTTDSGDGFVFFRRTRPDRTIFVHWTDGTPEFVSEQATISRREELAARYLEGDTIEWSRPVEAGRVDFAGLQAVRVSGWWGNKELVGGGPFRTYCFFEPSRQRVYTIDISLFAPSYDKTAMMRNLDAVAHTFTLDR